MARKHNITGAFLNNNNQEIPEKVARMFYKSKEWVVVYFDYDALIFLKNVPQNAQWINRFAIDLTKWEPKNLDLLKVGSRNVSPFMHTDRAYVLNALGLSDAALKELRQALLIDPAFAETHKLLGKIYGKKKKHYLAFVHFRLACTYAPRDKLTRHNLALAHENLKDYKGAIDQYEKIIDLAPNDPAAYFKLARAHALARQPKKAINVLKQARQMDPKDTVDVKKIRDIINRYNKNPEISKLLEEVAK